MIILLHPYVYTCMQNGHTALYLASMKGHVDVVWSLLQETVGVSTPKEVCILLLMHMLMHKWHNQSRWSGFKANSLYK